MGEPERVHKPWVRVEYRAGLERRVLWFFGSRRDDRRHCDLGRRADFQRSALS